MKLFWHHLLTVGALALLPLLSGCGGGAEKEAPAADAEKKPATTASKAPADENKGSTADAKQDEPAPGSAEAMLKKGDEEVEKAAALYDQARQEYYAEVNELVQAAQKAAAEGKAPDLESDANEKVLEAAKKKFESIDSELKEFAQNALGHYQKAAELDPKLADAYLGQFMVYSLMSEPDKAMESLNKGTGLLRSEIESGKPTPDKLAKLLQLYGHMRKVDEAEALLKDVQKKYPDDPELQAIATQALMEIEQFKNATPPGMPPGMAPAPAPEAEEGASE